MMAVLAPSLAWGAPPPSLAGATTRQVAFSDLAGWAHDDHVAAYRAFLRSCPRILAPEPAREPTAPEGATLEPRSADLAPACRDALAAPDLDDGAARAFFEWNFAPIEVAPEAGAGFLTGYFEPIYDGSRQPTSACPTPLLARPADLVDTATSDAPDGAKAARRTAGGLVPYPDRAAIESGALGDLARPIVYLDPVDAFMVQVQGSARIRLADGESMRVGYAGRNGLPYTSIGRVLAERLSLPPAEMTADRMVAWLKSHPEEEAGIMQANRSYVFFRRLDELGESDGPIGGAGVPLLAGRSLAVDHHIWTYGVPVWLEGRIVAPGGGDEALQRLALAQDTGTAIVGPARGDLFFGTGPRAGLAAGLVRAAIRFVVLWPRAAPAAP